VRREEENKASKAGKDAYDFQHNNAPSGNNDPADAAKEHKQNADNSQTLELIVDINKHWVGECKHYLACR